MSENTTPNENQPEARVAGIYLRNVSLETANSPLLLREGLKPEIKLELRVQINPMNEQEEVVLDLSITGRDGSSLLYLLKLQQAASVILKNFDENQKAFFLNTACPQMLYPYAAQVASTLIVQAGFPPLYLTPIDFVNLYTQQQAAQKTDSTPTNTVEESKWKTLTQNETLSTAIN